MNASLFWYPLAGDDAMNRVYIIGGAQSDFARNWTRDGKGLEAMLADTIYAALGSTNIDPARVETVHIGNFVAELFVKQGILGGVVAEAVPELRGKPSQRHEAACASGSMAILSASAEIEAGRYDCALVVGAELMRNVHGDVGAEYLGTAIWHGQEAHDATYIWPHMFSNVMEEYDQRYGLDYDDVGAIARLNYTNAKRNPNAQTRTWEFGPQSFVADDDANPIIEGKVRRNDCGQITDGAAAVLLASESFAREYAAANGLTLSDIPSILGWGHRSERIAYDGKISDSKNATFLFPTVRNTIEDALQRAKLHTIFDVDAVETHDCFAITEYMAIDHLGLTAPGKSFEAVRDGTIAADGQLPINPSGGLIGLGHPVGATGVRMLLDAYKQTTRTAGGYQVQGANKVFTLNIGGSTTTTACFVVGR